jgi:4-hydroxythreonine-4-phosphate dehydrogenase
MSKLHVAITTGDVDGIGLEVTIKALNKLKRARGVTFYIYRHKDGVQLPKSLFKKNFSVVEFVRSDSPADWVEEAGRLCLDNKYSAMVTGPISKGEIIRSGRSDIGHTDILKRLANVKTTFMVFLGGKFNVLLATGHINLHSVANHINKELLESAIYAASDINLKLFNNKRGSQIAILGLNPHAGDDNLIGKEESQIIRPLVERLQRDGVKIFGPLVPDTAFIHENLKKYTLFIALYHDQGLIPFKMAHGFNDGVHLTWGLPFVRTSVDHGTAKDIYGKNTANPNSMYNAITWALKLA